MKLIYIVGILISLWTQIYSWTKVYINSPIWEKGNFYKNNNIWIWEKKGIDNFNQLIFSWNALRPNNGSFIFSVQVRDNITKRWYPWHRVAQWGKNIQRSFSSTNSQGTQFVYVRLELHGCKVADGFRVRVKAKEGASLSQISTVVVNAVNLFKFNSEIYKRSNYTLPSIIINQVPKASQAILNHPKPNALCSPTSTSMLLGFLLKKKINPLKTAKGVHDKGLNAYGSWPFNIAHAYEESKGKFNFHVQRLDSFKDLHNYLLQSLPVVVSITGPLSGAASRYKNGHLLVVIGYDRRRRKVICHDPAFTNKSKIQVAYDLKPFLRAWERSRRLAYVVTRKDLIN